MVDFSGLSPAERYEELKAIVGPPEGWRALHLQKTMLYSHRQWRSPGRATGVGVAYIHLPIPLSSKAIIWFAKHEYSSRETGGRLIGEWADEWGRQWFEAENQEYHVRGYAYTSGFDAWIVYFGYKAQRGAEPSELSLAGRCMQAVILPGTSGAVVAER